VPRTAPFLLWSDPIELPWTDAERAALVAEGPAAAWLLRPIPPADHVRPLSAAESPTEPAVYGIWTFDNHTVDAPVFPVPVPPRYGDVVLRGLTAMVPALATCVAWHRGVSVCLSVCLCMCAYGLRACVLVCMC
jgi:hypothetical protein